MNSGKNIKRIKCKIKPGNKISREPEVLMRFLTVKPDVRSIIYIRNIININRVHIRHIILIRHINMRHIKCIKHFVLD